MSTRAQLLRKTGIRPAIIAPHAASSPRNGEAAEPERWPQLAEPDFTLPQHPPEKAELKRKRAQLSVLEAELARQERELSRLRAELRPFEARYFREVGIRRAKLDGIEARLAELYASIHPDDMAAQEMARRAWELAYRSWQEVPIRRWAAAAFLMTEKSFRKVMGYRDPWMLQAVLEGDSSSAQQPTEKAA